MLNDEMDDPFAAVTARNKPVIPDGDEGDDPFALVTSLTPQAPMAAPKVEVPQSPYATLPAQPMTMGTMGGMAPSFIPRAGQEPVFEPLPEAPSLVPPVDQSNIFDDLKAGTAMARQMFNAIPVVANTSGINVQNEAIARFMEQREQALKEGLLGKVKILDNEIAKRQAMIAQREAVRSEDIRDIAEATAVVNAAPINPAAKEFMKDENEISDLWRIFKSDPYGVTRTLVARSLPASVPSVAGTILGGVAAGPAGAFAGAGLGSAASEFGSSVVEQLTKLGADPNNPEQYNAIFEANKDEILNNALIRAGIIGAADAAGGAAAAKIGRAAFSALPQMLRGGAKIGSAIGVDAISGMAGEAGAQLGTEGEIKNLGEIAGEGIGAIGTGPLELIGQNKAEVTNNGETPYVPENETPVVGNLFGINQDPSDPFVGVSATPDPFAQVSAQFAEPINVVASDGSTPAAEAAGTATPQEQVAQEQEVIPPPPTGVEGVVSPASAGSEVPPAAPPPSAQQTGTPPAVAPSPMPQGATPTGGSKSTGIWAPIERGESTSYNALVFGKPGASVPKEADLTNMTIADVQQYQKGMRARGHASSAVGRWQMIEGTLKWAVDKMGLDPNTKFDKPTQDRIAQFLLDEKVGARRWREGKMSDAQLANNLRNEWEALKKAGYSDQQLVAWVREGGQIGDGNLGNSSGNFAGGSTGAGGGYVTPQGNVGLREDEVSSEPNLFGESLPPQQAPNGAVSVPSGMDEAQRRWTETPKVESSQLPTNIISTNNKAIGRLEVKPMVVDLASIMSSDDPNYPQELQPRDRKTRDASQGQIMGIVNDFDPNQIMPSPVAAVGPPIVNDKGQVESGNGRMMALRELYRLNSPALAEYHDMMRQRGFNIDGMRQPILVQQRMTPLTPDKLSMFVHNSNKPVGLTMSPPELANVEKNNITFDMLKSLEGRSNPAASGEFVREFFKNLSNEERGELITASGSVSDQGKARMQNAIFALAYGDSTALATIAEAADDDPVKGISNAMIEAAPAFARLNKLIDEGAVPREFDIRPELIEAVNNIRWMREKGMKFLEYIAQDNFLNPISPKALELMHSFYTGNRANSQVAVAKFLKFWADQASMIDVQAVGLGIGNEPITRDKLMETAQAKVGVNGRGSKEQSSFLDGQGNVAPVSGGDGQSPASGGQSQQGEGPNTEGRGEPQESGDNGGGRAKNGGRRVKQGPLRQARQDADERPERSGTPRRDEQAPLKVKGEGQRAAQTNRASVYEDVFFDLGYDPVEANLWPIEKQFAVISKGIKDKFGLAHVDKTPKAISRFAVDQLKDMYRNLQFMAGVLQLPNLSIGLNGHFGLTLRKGSEEYLGAYYPKKRTAMEGMKEGPVSIVVPGRASSFAHEWAHALDFKLGEIFRDGKTDKTGALTSYVQRLKAIGSKKLDQNSAIREVQQRVNLARAVADVLEATFYQADGKTLSDYFIETTKFANQKGSYWSDVTEMFARAFEAYVAFNSERFGGGTEFLSMPDRVFTDPHDGFIEKVYPNIGDRVRLFEAFDRLMTAVNENTDLSGPAASFPGNPTILPSAWRDISGGANRNSLKANLAKDLEPVRAAMRVAASLPQKIADANGAEMVQSGRNAFNFRFASMRGAMMSIQAKRKSAALQWVMDQFFHVPGVGRSVGRTYEAAREMKFKYFSGKLSKIIGSYGIDKYDGDQIALLRELLVTGGKADVNFTDITAPKSMKDAAVQLRRLMDEMYYYGKAEGELDIGYTKNGYLPRILDETLIQKDGQGFIDKAAEVYDIQFGREIGEDAKEIASLDLDSKRFEAWTEAYRSAKREGVLDAADVRAYLDALAAYRETPNATTRGLFLDAISAIYDQVREHAAQTDAINWHNNITSISLDTMLRDAPPSSFTKKRTLPPEADMILKDFYYNNPIDLIRRYASSMTRRVEFSKRFGKRGEKFEAALNRMRREGVSDDEIDNIKSFFKRITGTEGMDTGVLSRYFNTIYVLSTIRLMVRSLFTNLFEPFLIGIQTGRIDDVGRAAYGVGAEVADGLIQYFGGKGMSDIQFYQEMAEFSGIVADTLTEQVVQQHLSDQQYTSARITRLAANFYETIGLAGYTRVSRRVAMKIGMLELERSATRLLSGKDASKAQFVFSEGGIDPDMQQEFARWYLENYGDGRKTAVADIEDHPFTPYLQTFLARWVDQTIQDPKRVDKPYYATGNLGRAPFGLLSFGYSFFNNVVKRAIRASAGKAGLSGQERAKYIATTAGLASLYIFAQVMAGVSRTELYGAEDEKKKKRDALAKMMSGQFDASVADLINEGVSRSGFFGPLDPLAQHTYQRFRGERAVRYDATLPKLVLGPQLGSIVDDFSKVYSIYSPLDAASTKTAEFNAARGAFNLTMGYLSTAALGVIPFGPAGKFAFGNPVFGVPQFTAPSTRDSLLETATGWPKPQKGRKSKSGLEGLTGTGPKGTLKGL